MIDELSIKDFRGHADTELRLGRMTLLVGDNATGKSSILEALYLLSLCSKNPVGVLKQRWDPLDLTRRGADKGFYISVQGSHDVVPWNLTFAIERARKEEDAREPRWNAEIAGRLGNQKVSATSTFGQGGGSSGGGWENIDATMGIARMYRLRADRIAAPSLVNPNSATVEASGANAAMALMSMKLRDDEAFQKVEEALRILVPSVKRVRIRLELDAQLSHEIPSSQLYFDFHGAEGVPAHGASQGTLLALALLTVLYSERRPNVILLDDFDQALHPRAQAEVMRLLQRLLALEEFQDLQIVATSHSPYILDEVDIGDIYAFALRPNGTVATKPLSAHPKASDLKGALTAGQLWSLDSERNWVLAP